MRRALKQKIGVIERRRKTSIRHTSYAMLEWRGVTWPIR
jgi:hypothetical protein